MSKVVGITVGTPINPDKIKPKPTEIEEAVEKYLSENPIEIASLTDTVTGIEYKLAVTNGKLTLISE